MAQPHEPDINALLRLCDVQEFRLLPMWQRPRFLLKRWTVAILHGGNSFINTNRVWIANEQPTGCFNLRAHADDAEIGMAGTIAKHTAADCRSGSVT